MLKDKIQKDAVQALKAGESGKRLVLNMLLTAIGNKEIEKRTQLSRKDETENLEKKSRLTEEEILSVIYSETKKRKEAAEAFQKGGRDELAVKEKDELVILESYLPVQLSEDEVRKAVKQTIQETGAKDIKDMGRVIGAVMAKVKGRADGQMVSGIVKELLS